MERELGLHYLDRIDWIHDGVFLWPLVSRRPSRRDSDSGRVPVSSITHSNASKGTCSHVLQQREVWRKGFIAATNTTTVSPNCNKTPRSNFLPQTPPLAHVSACFSLHVVRRAIVRNREESKAQKLLPKGRGVWLTRNPPPPPACHSAAGPSRPQRQELRQRSWN